MKKLLLILCLFSFHFSNAQCFEGDIEFHYQSDIDSFFEAFPDCTEILGSVTMGQLIVMEDQIQNLDAFENVTSIQGDLIIGMQVGPTLDGLINLETVGGSIIFDNTPIENLNGLSNLTSIGGFKLINTYVTSLAPLNNLTEVTGDFQITSENLLEFDLNFNVEIIGGSLKISVDNTDINGLDSIKHIGGDFWLMAHNITNIDGLQNIETIGGNFWVMNSSQVTTLEPLSSLTSVGWLDITFNNISSLQGLHNLNQITGGLTIYGENITDISALSGITSLNGTLQIQNTKLTTLQGLHNINTLGEEASLNIYENTLLTDISALQHINPFSFINLNISNNTSLAVCSLPNFCFYFQDDDVFGYYNLYNNAPGCIEDEMEDIIYDCNALTSNILSGTVRFNYDNDDCGSLVHSAQGIKVTSTSDEGIIYSTYTNYFGEYELFVPEGSYTTTAIIDIPSFEVLPSSATTSFTGVGNESDADFCISASQVIDDIRITIYPVTPSSPGFDACYKILCENVGTVAKTGNITFAFDPSKLIFLSASSTPASVTDGLITFNYLSFLPFKTRHYFVYFNVLAPPVNNIDEVLNFTATINPVEGDVTPGDNVFTYDEIIVGPYDPNDKTVAEGSEVLIEDSGEYLNYRIRFQNTGTAPAINVRLEDLLDENLDLQTFEPVAGSHNTFRVELTERQLKIFFDNIYLPAEEDDPAGSNGFFMYRIKPKAGMQVGDIISNTAEIYFDFNTPIITNTVTTEFVEPAGITGNDLLQVAIYPNPATAVLNFRTATAITAVELYNGLGQKVTALKAEAIDSLNVSQLANGVYFCHLHDGYGNTSIHKIIINK